MPDRAVVEPDWIANCCCFCGQTTTNGRCPDHDLMTMHDCDAGNPPGWLNDIRCHRGEPFVMSPPPLARPFDAELQERLTHRQSLDGPYWLRSRRHG